MKRIPLIYQELTEHLSEIKVTDIFEFRKGSIDDPDKDVPGIDYQDFFNGKNRWGFLEDMDRIIFSISKELSEYTGLDKLSVDEENEIDELISDLSTKIQNRESFILSETAYVPFVTDSINSLVEEIIKRLAIYKDTWRLKSEIAPTLPGNFALQWNENINKLADLFYQLTEEVKNSEKKPLVKTSKTNLANFIVNNFVDRDGKNLKFESVYTVLKNSRPDKRPAPGFKLEIRYLPM